MVKKLARGTRQPTRRPCEFKCKGCGYEFIASANDYPIDKHEISTKCPICKQEITTSYTMFLIRTGQY